MLSNHQCPRGLVGHPELSAGHRGFTLVELLVVITIVALLLSILLPAIGSAKDLSTRLNCASRERALGMSSIAYTSDYKDAFAYTVLPYRSNTNNDANAVASNSSVNALLYYCNNSFVGWYCPTESGTFSNYKWNLGINPPTAPVSNIWWGYFKLAGTVSGFGDGALGLGAQPRYFHTGSLGYQLTTPNGVPNNWTGYMRQIEVDTAPRTSIHLGEGNLNTWAAPQMSQVISVAAGANQPPSQIALYSEEWDGGVSFAILHNNNRKNPASFWNPVSTQGRNEFLDDGHVTWYDTDRNEAIFYRTWTGQFLGMWIQDDQ